MLTPKADGRPSFWERPSHALPDREKTRRGATLVGQGRLAASTLGKKTLTFTRVDARRACLAT
jgi:hypothetical protein